MNKPAWRVADSILYLKDTIQELRPDLVKQKRIFGTIGDSAHASRDSDHNPWIKDRNGIGVVRALDIPIEVGNGHKRLANRLRKLAKGSKFWRRPPHPAFGSHGYIISNRRIASKKTNWKWVPYRGTNPHTSHIHVSVGRAPSKYDSSQKWNIKPRHVRK